MAKAFAFTEKTARTLSKVARERQLLSKFAWGIVQPGPSAVNIRSYIVKLGTTLAAATTADGGDTWTMHHTTCSVYIRSENLSEKFSQDVENTITADTLVQALTPDSSNLEVRVFNATTTVIPANKPTHAIQDAFGDLYIVAPASTAQGVVVFQLTATLSPGSTGYSEAAAKICNLILPGSNYIYDATGADIVVVDWDGALWRGVSGSRGLATLRTDGKYDIIFMSMPDGIFEFTVYADRNPAYDFITVTATAAYQQGAGGINLGSGAITMYDSQHLYNRALVGGKGVGFYDYYTNSYRVISCQQQCITATALINQTGGLTDLGAVAIDTFVATSPSPFNLVPATAPTTAYNPRQHYGKDNDTVWLQWNDSTSHWEVTDVIRHVHNTLTDIRQNAGNTYFEAEQVQAALEYHEDPSYSNKIAIGACP